jgi:three-Cys-motif partner protein
VSHALGIGDNMPKQDGIGYGEQTSTKISHLSKIVGMHLNVTHSVLRKNPYFKQKYRYIDITAGKGFTPDGNIGSPIIFLQQAESTLGLSYRADFIECLECNFTNLQANIKDEFIKNGWEARNIYFHHGKYEDIIPSILQKEDSKELGLVYVDHSGEPPDLATLQYITRLRPRMDILIYIPATNIKRIFPVSGRMLSDYMREIGKVNWLIRKPIKGDRHQWTFLLGSNSDLFENYKSIEFYKLESEEAQKFFPKLNLSKKQLQEKIQPRLL